MHRVRAAVVLLSAVALAATACGSAPSAQGDGAAEEQTRQVSHVYGQARVPADPQRVVVLHTSAVLGTALLLGVPVVGYPALPYADGALPYFDDAKLAEARDVAGSFPEPDIEAVAATRPDLIIGTTGFVDEAAYRRLTEIAPTVVLEIFGSTPWKDALREIAAVFGEQQRIEQGIDRFERRVEQLRTALRGRAGNTTVTLANVRALDDIRIYTSDWCSGRTLRDVGLVRPPEQRVDDTIKLSIELLPRLDADVLLYFVGSSGTDPDEAGQAEARITSHPLWDTLGAVRSGQAHQVDRSHWFTCTALQAQHLVLDDLERLLLDGRP
ncbi:MAG: ABC transporter substrate-binding protein [Pseudonocardiaceae bacterium]|nr:ABC transporter substrate-binding protein [Pseudonocardiaceae bacterium]